jgi:hypothetical protein
MKDFIGETAELITQFLIILSILLPVVWAGWKKVKQFVIEQIKAFVDDQLSGFIKDHKGIKNDFHKFLNEDFDKFIARVESIEKGFGDLNKSFREYADRTDMRLQKLESSGGNPND